MDLEAVPLDVALHAHAGIGVIWVDQAQGVRRALFWVPPSHLAVLVEQVLLHSCLAQDLDGGQVTQPAGGVWCVHVGQQTHAVAAACSASPVRLVLPDGSQ